MGAYDRKPWGRQKPPLGSQLDRSSPFASGLVGCWLFNEGSGGIANDLSNENNTITTMPLGLSSYGYNMPADDYTKGIVLNKHKGVSDTEGTFIISVIPFEASSGTTDYRFLFDSDTSTHRLYHDNSSANVIQFANDGRRYPITLIPYGAYTPQTFACVYKKSTDYARVFQNGAILANGMPGGSWGSNTIGANLYIARPNSAGNQCFLGAYISYMIFNGILTAAEVQSLYEQPYQMIEGYNLGRFFSVPSGITYYDNLIGESILIGNNSRLIGNHGALVA